MRYELLTTPFDISLAQGLAAIGRFAEGMALIDETIRRGRGERRHLVTCRTAAREGRLLLAMPQPGDDDAEMCFMQSLELSRRQGAARGSCAPRSTSQRCWPLEEQSGDARALLQPVFEQFTEGRDTADLKAAERLLATLDQ